MMTSSPRKAIAALEFLVVVAAVSLMSWLVVRCHTASIWMDIEFTGWVAPIANRMDDGLRLYSDHRHSPMPPLPVLLTRAASGGHATWFTESATIVVCQSLLIVIMYLGLARSLPRPIPLVATLLSIPVYFALFKTISYDAITQVLVALSAVTAVAVAGAPSRGATAGKSRAGAWPMATGPSLCALMGATTILSKQSTGVGLVLGIALVLAVAGPRTWRTRLIRAVVFLGLTPAIFLILCLLIRPWVDVRSMIQDIFLIGSEPKGGSRMMLFHLKDYAAETFERVVPFLIYGIGFAGALRRMGRGEAEPSSPPGPGSFGGKTALAASMAAIVAPIALMVLSWREIPWSYWLQFHFVPVSRTVLWAGLLMLMLSALLRRPLPGPPVERRPTDGPIALFLVLFPAAVFHSLSVGDFRWTYDNNPLITVALAGIVYALFAVLSGGDRRRPGRLGASAAVAGVLVLSCVIPSLFCMQLRLVQECTEEWPEVAHLKGAKLRKGADGMRNLVATVRNLAPDPGKDAVLLLPNDPNVEAWFDRPRPDLSSQIIFTDQYWDRYVDRDFEALAKAPPRVIIIGPRDYWRGFQIPSNFNKGSGRLIDLVRTSLLPDRYTAHAPQPILFEGHIDHMDIYVRNDDGRRPIVTAAGIR